MQKKTNSQAKQTLKGTAQFRLSPLTPSTSVLVEICTLYKTQKNIFHCEIIVVNIIKKALTLSEGAPAWTVARQARMARHL